MRVLEQERSKLEKQRKTQLKDFETAKNDARRLLEVRWNTHFDRDAFDYLCSCFF